ncbi:hypothetical protein HMPREF0653_00862 [Prevotella disiens JCM 6334 = ATCC 29426]|uniref:Lipocalin-like domain-containing protein n=3 Tax=Prevotella disiens TaxID=28130 RepID=E1KS83_9BACT|nr:lipocalin-like domain-containing protein [Prevotella disiens]EFL45458.1 hypothetical protein HMPREF9296_1544 [Prevotella disiens FB035-09AN]ERJ78640.1 hypothetical protein HMPREF0653_00862 [Prevotella disiens JCM 6334 = ATCC 29426]SUB85284.1 Uncharacterised protein [Prevotella disiens]
MKKYIKLLFSLLAMLGITSCSLDTDNTPGDLEGMWKCTAMEQNGQTVDVAEKQIFWSFQAKLLQIEDKIGTQPRILYHYNLNGSILELNNPYLYDRDHGDKPLTEPTLLAFYGINAMNTTFTIEFAKGKKELTLATETYKLYFKKF